MTPSTPTGRARVSFLVAGIFITSAAKCDEPPKAVKDPVLGQLRFRGWKPGFDGTDVGVEFHKRKYSAGHPASPERGVWGFDTLPRGLITAPDDV